MNAIAAQKWTRMLGRSMAIGSIGVSATPGKDGSAINNQVAGPNEPTVQSDEDGEDKKRFRQRCSGTIAPLPLLRGARDAGTAILPQRQAARQS